MRIIAGQFRGIGLAAVGKGDPAAHLRPTSDRVRESLFSILAGGRYDDAVHDAHVLDLFAGTGALGLEALSRGAAYVTFVENGRASLRLLDANIAKLRIAEGVKVERRTVLKPLRLEHPASLVFLDPPYGTDLGEKALLAQASNIVPGALVVWEDDQSRLAPAGFETLEDRQFGATVLNFLQRVEQ